MKLPFPRFCFLAGFALATTGCATPASVPDRSTSTRPERTLDRGFTSSGVAPTAPGETQEGRLGNFPSARGQEAAPIVPAATTR